MKSGPPRIFFDHEPDSLERKVRIGCGAAFGLFAGTCSALGWGLFFGWEAWVLILLLTCTCAWLALRYGDDFWHKALKYLPWI